MPRPSRRVAEVDVDLQLVPPARPGTVARPDIVVVPRAALDRQRAAGRSAARLGGRAGRRDHLTRAPVASTRCVKRSEYADAGIPHYWVVDLGEPDDRPQLTAHHLAGEFGYADAGPVVGDFTATEPFPVRIDLDALV